MGRSVDPLLAKVLDIARPDLEYFRGGKPVLSPHEEQLIGLYRVAPAAVTGLIVSLLMVEEEGERKDATIACQQRIVAAADFLSTQVTLLTEGARAKNRDIDQ